MTAGPNLNWDLSDMAEVMSYAPCFEASLAGPIPFGGTHRIRFAVKAMVVPTREDAERVAWDWARRACAAYGYPFLEEEWELIEIRSLNQN